MVVALESMSNVLKLITPVSAEVTQNLVLLDLLATGGKDISKLIDRTNVYFTSIKTLANTLLGFRDDAVNKATGTEIFNGISNINDAIVAMGISKGNSVLASLETNMKAIDFEKLEVIQNRMNRLSKIMDGMKTSLEKMKTAFDSGALKNSFSNITSVIEAVKRLNESLASVNLGTVNASMEHKGGNIVSKDGKLKVESQGSTFNINIAISMSGHEMEKAILLREGSVIRDRLNYALGNAELATEGIGTDGLPTPATMSGGGTRNVANKFGPSSPPQ
jgi:hypothetical protein